MTEDDQLPLSVPGQDGAMPVWSGAASLKQEAAVEPAVAEASEHTDWPVGPSPSGVMNSAGNPVGDGAAEGADEIRAATPTAQDSPQAPDVPAQAVAAATGVPGAAPAVNSIFYLTNRMNLNGILSSRLIAPRASFDKYYVDLLDQTPGWVPLLTRPPSGELLQDVTSERGAGVPVIVEFPRGALGKSGPTEPVVYVAAMALAGAIAIHFPSERDLREHRARSYSNIHAHDDLLQVTPELFAADPGEPVTLQAPSEVPVVDWKRVDRTRGALNAALTSATTGEQLALVAALFGAARLPEWVSLPRWLELPEINASGESDSGPPLDRDSPDLVSFGAVYDVLGERDITEAWVPNEVLDAVEARIRQAGLSAEAADATARNFDRVRSIVNVEVDFEPFRPSLQALASAKALLLVLLRQELGQLLTWPEEETGADDVTQVVSGLFAGRLRGLSRESVELRSMNFDDLTAAWAVRTTRGGSSTLGRVQFIANSRRTVLKIDGIEVATRSAPMPDLLAKYRKTSDMKKEALRIKVARAMGWPVELRIHLPSDATVVAGGATITVATTGEIAVMTSMDEDVFVQRLASLSRNEQKRAVEAFSGRRP